MEGAGGPAPPMWSELCASSGGIFDDEFFAANLAGEISDFLNGLLSYCDLFLNNGGFID